MSFIEQQRRTHRRSQVVFLILMVVSGAAFVGIAADAVFGLGGGNDRHSVLLASGPFLISTAMWLIGRAVGWLFDQ